jgi:hypothetical protein
MNYKELSPKSRFYISVNSLCIFLISYLLVYHIYLGTTALVASLLGIKSSISINNVHFLVSSSSWTPSIVKIVFLAAPLVCLAISFCASFVYRRISVYSGQRKLFIFWTSIISFVFFAGEIFAGAFIFEGVGYALSWLFIMDTLRVIIIIICIFSYLFIGLRVKEFILQSGNMYFGKLRSHDFYSFSFYQFIIPLIAGNLIFWLIKLPFNREYDNMVNLSSLLLLPALFINNVRLRDSQYLESSQLRIRINYKYGTIAIAMLGTYYMIHNI